MIDLWVLILLIPTFLWALSNFYDKVLVERVTLSSVSFIFFSNQFIPIFAILIVILAPIEMLEWHIIVLLLLQGFALVYIFTLYGKALQHDNGSHIGSLFGLITLFLVFLEFIFLGVVLSIYDYIGIGGIVLSSLLLTTSQLSIKMFKPRLSLYYMIVLTFLLAISFTLLSYYLQYYNFSTITLYLLIGGYIGVLSLLLKKKNREYIKKTFKIIISSKLYIFLLIFANLVTETADILYYYIISLAPSVTIVSAIANIQFIFAYLLGIIFTLLFPSFIQEDLSLYQILRRGIAIVLMIGGILLIQVI
ncbi:MAG: EamA family transporter [Candidatus Nanoarchaeia archaeon]